MAELIQLSRLQAWLAASSTCFLERPGSLRLPGLIPPTHRLSVHMKLPGHFGLGEPLVEEFSGLESPLFQLVEIAFNAFGVTHAQRLARESTIVTILYDTQ